MSSMTTDVSESAKSICINLHDLAAYAFRNPGAYERRLRQSEDLKRTMTPDEREAFITRMVANSSWWHS